jgi:hypothetical protein
VTELLPSKAPEPFLPPGMTFPEIASAFNAEGYGDAEPKTESEVFVRECLEWLAEWFQLHAQTATSQGIKPFMFVFDASRRTSDVMPGSKILPAFKQALESQIGGRIYASSSNLKQVHGVATELGTCSELLGHLADSHQEKMTAIAVSPVDKTALIHLGGDLEEAYRIPFKRFTTEGFDFLKLDDYLRDFYEAHVSTNDGYCDVWAKAGKRQLKMYPERQIQKTLQAFFVYGVLPLSAKIYREIQTHAGREDLRIIRANKTNGTLDGVVLELKVLAPTKTDEKNLEWAKEGVDQAASYAATDKMTAHRYVCCYDARKDDAPMPEGVAYAKQKLVTWRRYFMQTPGISRKTIGFDS